MCLSGLSQDQARVQYMNKCGTEEGTAVKCGTEEGTAVEFAAVKSGL